MGGREPAGLPIAHARRPIARVRLGRARREEIVMTPIRTSALSLVAVLCLAAATRLSPAGARPQPAAPAASPPHPGVVLTHFVRTTLVPRFLVIERALLVANRTVLAYEEGRLDARVLASVLAVQDQVLRGSSQDLASLSPPWVAPQLTLQTVRLLEDLAACSDQLATLLEDVGTAGSVPPRQVAGVLDIVAYAPRLGTTLSLLQRAADWLAAIDSETGTHTLLQPGFTNGRSPGEQLDLGQLEDARRSSIPMICTSAIRPRLDVAMLRLRGAQKAEA
jgi:hypothetical protein